MQEELKPLAPAPLSDQAHPGQRDNFPYDRERLSITSLRQPRKQQTVPTQTQHQ
ncbi:hypothetical protein GPB2148_3556 [marine gamma proteobacterium HTCC2148]|nr:hypothetical protein GPB2148_3556 [marine gamma proteobacterium HTCC2148]